MYWGVWMIYNIEYIIEVINLSFMYHYHQASSSDPSSLKNSFMKSVYFFLYSYWSLFRSSCISLFSSSFMSSSFLV